jgi:hypothetical protein
MNIVEVSGGKAKEREIVEATVYLCIKKLMPRIKTLEIDVTVKNMHSYGNVMMMDGNRHFDLEIKRGLNIFDLITTVCHEMIHVKQFVRKELFVSDEGLNTWKEKQFLGDIQYKDLPWEKEAFAKEEALALECFKEINVVL